MPLIHPSLINPRGLSLGNTATGAGQRKGRPSGSSRRSSASPDPCKRGPTRPTPAKGVRLARPLRKGSASPDSRRGVSSSPDPCGRGLMSPRVPKTEAHATHSWRPESSRKGPEPPRAPLLWEQAWTQPFCWKTHPPTTLNVGG